MLYNWKRLAVPVLGAATLVFVANPALAGKGGGGGGRGGGGGGMRAAGFRGGPSGMSRGWGGPGNWNGRGWGREGGDRERGWDRGAWGWWGGGYYNPWYGDGYGGYAYGGYPSDYSSFYSGPATYSDDTSQGYADQGSAASTMPDENAAMIAVRVPPNADIWFDGEKTNQKGTVRQFETPALDPGHDYSYEVRARWNENGRNVERTRHVTVHAGDRIGLNFMEPRGARGERPADYDRSGRDTDMRDRDGSTRDGDRQNRDRNGGDDQIRDRTHQNNAPSKRSNQPPRPGNVPPPDTDG